MVENKKLLIIDASVILKWILLEQEDHKEKALLLRKDFLENKVSLGIPTMALYEIMNILAIKMPNIAVSFLSQLMALQMTEFRLTLDVTATAIEIMKKFKKISFYDSAYHAIALNNNGIFITSDKQYYQKTKSLKHIELLKNYK